MWEDDGTLQWKRQLTEPAPLESFVSKQVPGVVREPQPQHRHLILIEPTEPFDLSTGAGIGAARRAQWWKPGTSTQCILDNRTKAPAKAAQGIIVATAVCMNIGDRARPEGLLEAHNINTSPREGGRAVVRPFANDAFDTPDQVAAAVNLD